MTRLPLRSIVAAMILAATMRAAAQSEMRLDIVRQSLTGTHRHYTQYIGGVEVVGGERSETLLPEGALRVNFDQSARLPRETARVKAARVNGASATGESVYLNVGGEARAAYRSVVFARPLEPHARYFDAVSGTLLRDDPLFFTARGRVFDVNPVAKLNAPWLRDDNGSATAVPEEAYSEVDLLDLAPSGPLSGANVQIVDIQEPFTPHADAALSLDYNRSAPQFGEVNAYFQIDRAQRYLQSLGYDGARRLVAYAIPVDPHAANGTDNSYYLEGSFPGRGTLYFGDGGTPDAEDSDIVLHEFMHAVHDWIIPGGLSGSSSSQARAASEGLGDYWSFSSTYTATTASGRDPFCIGDWDARCGGDDPSRNCAYPIGADCLRRVDSSKTMADYVSSEAAGTEHLNGEIWSSALREMFMALAQRYGVAEGKRVSDTIVVESLFGLPPGPDFKTMARSMIAADGLIRGASETDVICTAMTKRGIFAPAECGNTPRGEWTLVQSSSQGLPIPDGSGLVVAPLTISDTRLIDRLAVRVDVAHPSRGDLVVSLTAPDGRTVKLKESSQIDRTPDVHATFGLEAASAESLDVFRGQPANGVWTLAVSDVYAGDAGVLQGWSLLIAFAGDVRLSSRPTTAAARIIVPVVAHAAGAAGTAFRSDVYLLNRGSRETTVTLIFTPSGANGTAAFAAVKVSIAPGQTAAFRDVVASVFAMTGTGTLEIQGDAANLLASSQAVNATPGGFVAQSIDATSSTNAAGPADPPLELFPVVPNGGWRCNFGLVETAGFAGRVRLLIRTLAGDTVATVDYALQPYMHTQVPLLLPASASLQFGTVSVVSGNARVIAYISAVDNLSGDAMTVVGRTASLTATQAVVPVVASTTGIAGKQWMTELWYGSIRLAEDHASFDLVAPTMTFYPSSNPTPIASRPLSTLSGYVNNTLFTDFGQRGSATGHLELQLPPKTFVMTRTYTTVGAGPIQPGGSVGQRIEPVPTSMAIVVGGSVDALPIERSTTLRTNFGLVEVDGMPVDVRVTLFDAGGNLLARSTFSIGAHQHLQLPTAALYAGDFQGARLHFEAIGGTGRIAAYGSIVDSTTSDPFFILAR